MRRVRSLIPILLTLAVIVTVIVTGARHARLGLPEPNELPPQPPDDGLPVVDEYTPAGFDRFRKRWNEFTRRIGQPDGGEQGAIGLFCSKAAARGWSVEAYRAVPAAHRGWAFRAIADQVVPALRAKALMDRPPTERADELRRLLAIRSADAPNDPWVRFYTGEVLIYDDKREEADAEYAAAMTGLAAQGKARREGRRRAASAAEWDWDRVRATRVRNLAALGRWHQAYTECEPAADTFDQLAYLLMARNDAAAVRELVGLHRAQSPDDPVIDRVLRSEKPSVLYP